MQEYGPNPLIEDPRLKKECSATIEISELERARGRNFKESYLFMGNNPSVGPK